MPVHYKGLNVQIDVGTGIFNFWYSSALALRTERQSAPMSKIKNGGLELFGAGSFEHQQFRTLALKGLIEF